MSLFRLSLFSRAVVTLPNLSSTEFEQTVVNESATTSLVWRNETVAVLRQREMNRKAVVPAKNMNTVYSVVTEDREQVHTHTSKRTRSHYSFSV